tara:strand:+ start:6424 stop:6681 length:258 start_codon:yes stop_codon:yes gene_type:complete
MQESNAEPPCLASDEKKELSMMFRMDLSRELFLDHSDNILGNSKGVHVDTLSPSIMVPFPEMHWDKKSDSSFFAFFMDELTSREK